MYTSEINNLLKRLKILDFKFNFVVYVNTSTIVMESLAVEEIEIDDASSKGCDASSLIWMLVDY